MGNRVGKRGPTGLCNGSSLIGCWDHKRWRYMRYMVSRFTKAGVGLAQKGIEAGDCGHEKLYLMVVARYGRRRKEGCC